VDEPDSEACGEDSAHEIRIDLRGAESERQADDQTERQPGGLLNGKPLGQEPVKSECQ
jgi:hypothetical protein